MIRIVVDTNVYISGLMFGGLPGSLLELVLNKSFETIISPILLDEIEEILLRKFAVTPNTARLQRARIAAAAREVTPSQTIRAVPDDQDDDRVLECAVEGNADYIITGDQHLLSLKQFREIPILRVREFFDAVEFNPPNQ